MPVRKIAASMTKALTVTPSLPHTGAAVVRRTSYGVTAEYGFNPHPDFASMGP